MQEAVVTVPRALIAETIDIVAVLAGRGSSRRLIEIALVDGLDPATGDYRTIEAKLETRPTVNPRSPMELNNESDPLHFVIYP